MPSPAEILSGLALIANRYLALAIAWHVLVLVVVVALLIGIRPERRASALWLVTPLVSVSALAWSVGNPFNGLAFVVVAAALTVVALRLPREQVMRAPTWANALGIVALAYAWIYPHFLVNDSVAWYLIAAPMGLLPCPTLSMVLGFGLLADGFRSRAWSLIVAMAGLFYALFGIVRLGVWLDAGLLVAAAGMLAIALRPR